MSSAQDSFRHLLKESGYSSTNARSAVFEALLGQEPMSMHQLIERAATVDRASVYRTIELFEQLGIVQRLAIGWKYKIELTDKFSAHHHHLTCTQCSRITTLNENELERLIEQMARSHGFVPSSHQIEIQGICGECAGRASTTEKQE